LIKILIVEDNKYIQEGWQTFIDHDKELVVLDSFENCERLLVSKELKKADVIIMDIGLPGMTGIEGVKAVKALYPSINIIMATVHDDNEHIFDAIKAGAVGYLLKGVSPSELILAIKDAHAGGSPITPNIARKILEKMHAPVIAVEERLTERELEILQELATGKSYAAIGNTIFLSVDGVRHHIRKIYQKLQVNSRTEAVSKGIKKRLIDPE
jgi:DNA-binding NarL/FixJ family response regulator